MIYNHQYDFFLVTDEDTGDHHLFTIWLNAAQFIYDQMVEWGALVYDKDNNLISIKDISFYDFFRLDLTEVNELTESYFSIEKIQFADRNGLFGRD